MLAALECDTKDPTASRKQYLQNDPLTKHLETAFVVNPIRKHFFYEGSYICIDSYGYKFKCLNNFTNTSRFCIGIIIKNLSLAFWRLQILQTIANKGARGGPRAGQSFSVRCAHCASWCFVRLRRAVGGACSVASPRCWCARARGPKTVFPN